MLRRELSSDPSFQKNTDPSERRRVRHGSQLKGSFERGFYRPLSKVERRAILHAARLYERHTKHPGARQGALGTCGLEVLSELIHLCDKRTGRLEPSLATLCQRLRRSKDAVTNAIRQLEETGFLERVRRYERVAQQGPGPRIQQTSNAYRLLLPDAPRQLLGEHGNCPQYVDPTTENNERDRDKLIREGFETRSVGLALAGLHSAMSASPLSGLNPTPYISTVQSENKRDTLGNSRTGTARKAPG